MLSCCATKNLSLATAIFPVCLVKVHTIQFSDRCLTRLHVLRLPWCGRARGDPTRWRSGRGAGRRPAARPAAAAPSGPLLQYQLNIASVSRSLEWPACCAPGRARNSAIKTLEPVFQGVIPCINLKFSGHLNILYFTGKCHNNTL